MANDNLKSLNVDFDDLVEEFDYNSRDLLNDDEKTISLDDISFDVVGSTEDKFDGKFYVNYVGINPCTILKEDINLLEVIVRQNMDYNKLNFLIKNLKNFRNYSRNIAENIEDNEDRQIALDMIKKLNHAIEVFEELLGSDRIYLRDLKLKKEYKKELEGLMSSKTEINEIFDDIKLNNINNNYKEEDYKYIKSLCKSMNYIFKIVDERKDKELSLKIGQYRRSQYKYTPEEFKIMKLLEFPVAIAGNENIFSQNVNLDMKRTYYNVTGYYTLCLYNLLLDMILIGVDKTKLLSYYR